MRKLLVVALFVNAALLAGRFWQELAANAQGGGGPVATQNGDVNGDGRLDIADAHGASVKSRNRLIWRCL